VPLLTTKNQKGGGSDQERDSPNSKNGSQPPREPHLLVALSNKVDARGWFQRFDHTLRCGTIRENEVNASEGEDVLNRLKTAFRSFLQTAAHDVIERADDSVPFPCQGRRVTFENGMQCLNRIFFFERLLPGEHLV